jgi:hypothetical protein
MVPLHPKTCYVQRRHAPRHAPCPHGGAPGTRKQLLRRTVRGLAYHCLLLVRVTPAEYRAGCGCCTTSRTQVAGIAAKAQDTNQVRQAVLDRLLEDRMSGERLLLALRRDFLLELSAGFVYDCLRWPVGQLDHAADRAWAVQQFAGTRSVDEIHLGQYTLLLATDPLADLPVAFALVRRNDQEHLRRFLGQLKDHGFAPRVVITDGSSLYPTVAAASELGGERFEKLIAFLRSPAGQRVRTIYHWEMLWGIPQLKSTCPTRRTSHLPAVLQSGADRLRPVLTS